MLDQIDALLPRTILCNLVEEDFSYLDVE